MKEYPVNTALKQYRDDVSLVRQMLKMKGFERAIMKLTVLESSLNTALATLTIDIIPSLEGV